MCVGWVGSKSKLLKSYIADIYFLKAIADYFWDKGKKNYKEQEKMHMHSFS